MINKEDYVARISNASALQLVVINYELAISFIDDAIAVDDGPREQYEEQIKKARDALSRLVSALDMDYEVAHMLFSQYLHVNKLLNTAGSGLNRRTKLEEARDILQILLSGWQALEKEQKNAQPVMENAQQIYAGLTYKNGKLDEYIDGGGKGYEA